MCLLVVRWREDPDLPLIIGANRDERLDRPATAWTLLDAGPPRLVGGRDELAGGSWLAINDRGVFAGLTNQPAGERDPAKRSRGELPLLLTRHDRVDRGVEQLLTRVRSEDYNPAWLIAGDRERLVYVELGAEGPPIVRELSAGTHVLENVALDAPSVKVAYVRSVIDGLTSTQLWDALPTLLASHDLPAEPSDRWPEDSPARRRETLAPCVHTPTYGTRSSTLIRVTAAPDTLPEVRVADGPPCTTPYRDASSWWGRENKSQPARN
ncbi:MAG: NRDE family protein [Acidimicrobiales bacterium]